MRSCFWSRWSGSGVFLGWNEKGKDEALRRVVPSTHLYPSLPGQYVFCGKSGWKGPMSFWSVLTRSGVAV